MRHFAALLLAGALLAGCATVTTAPESPASQAALQLAQSGRFREAAQAWTALADASRGVARDHARLQAADAFLRDGQPGAAQTALAEVRRRRVQGDDGLLHDLLSAHFLLGAGHAREAAALLQQASASIPPAWAMRWHDLRARLFEAQGDAFASASEAAFVAADSRDPSTRANIVSRIERALAGLDDRTLAQRSAALPVGHPLYPYAGRALTRRGLPLPRPYLRATLPESDVLPPAEPDGYRPPLRVAVLLPLTGPLAAAGQSVRDGLLTAYFAETRRRPSLHFHDTGKGIGPALAAARNDRAQLLIGPLTRDEVSALFEQGASDIPVLALNRGTGTPPDGSAAFALSPEDEGAASADRLVDRGLLRVLAVHQDDDTAQRALASFRERLQSRGGEVVGDVRLSESNPDYVPLLQQGLAATAGNPPQALFLTLKAAPARLLAAQLELVGLAELPRTSTSLILAGGNPRMDGELDGVEFPELPWLLGLRDDLPEPEDLARRLPSAQGSGARLFAFGMDAWRLAGYLDHLGKHPDAMVRGATGELRLDGFGTITRDPEWAVFSGGRPRPALDGALLPDASQTP